MPGFSLPKWFSAEARTGYSDGSVAEWTVADGVPVLPGP